MTSSGETGSLRATAVRGVKWTSTSAAYTFAVSVLQAAIVAHFIAPRQYGLVTTVVLIGGFALAITDLGISNAIIARQISDRATLASLYWTNIAVGTLLGGVVFVCAPLLADAYGQPALIELLRWSSLGFLIAPLGQQFQVLLQKRLQFERMAIVEIASMTAGFAVAVAAAATGHGALSLVWAALVLATVKAAILCFLGWRTWPPSARPRLRLVREHLGFGAYQVGAQALDYLNANVDFLLISAVLGPKPLGYYALGYQLIIRPLMRLNPIVTRVAFPVYAQRQGDEATIRRGLLEVTRLIAFVSAPLLCGLAVAAPWLVPVALGPRWAPSIVVVQILAGVGLVKALYNPVGSVLLAKNRPDLEFKFGLVVNVVLVVVLGALVPLGIVAVSWGQLAVTVAAFAFGRRLVDRVIGLSTRQYVATVARPIAIALASSGVVLAVALVADPTARPQPLLVAGLAALGALVHAGLVSRFDAAYVRWLWSLLRRERAADAPSGPVPVPQAAQ
jgi:O-antigen/teichoic acid export membrane protein